MRRRYFTVMAASVFAFWVTGCYAPSKVKNDKSKNASGPDDKVMSDLRQKGLSQPTHYYLTEINSKVMRSFISSYSNVTDPKFVKYYGGYVVYFAQDDIRYKVYYMTTGELKCTIRQYEAKYLPIEYRQLVQNAYPGYSIFLVTEVIKKGRIRYEVKIENEASFKDIRLEDGGIKVASDYVKSK
jgi:hypothetical protein